jgi:uncharacterized RDD family membrane protein YckC
MGPAATCDVCAHETPVAWERCGHCGAQRLLALDGSVAGYRRYAGFWRRGLAVILDCLLVAGPFALVLWLLPGRERLDLAGVAVFVLVAYGMGLPAWSGDTWGKRLVRAHIVEDDGFPVGRGRVSAREGVGKVLTLAGPILIILGVALLVADPNDDSDVSQTALTVYGVIAICIGAPGLVALPMAAFDTRKRALHDRMAGTVCVRGRPVEHPARFTGQP